MSSPAPVPAPVPAPATERKWRDHCVTCGSTWRKFMLCEIHTPVCPDAPTPKDNIFWFAIGMGVEDGFQRVMPGTSVVLAPWFRPVPAN